MASAPLWRSEGCRRQASSISEASKVETNSGSLPSHGAKRKRDMRGENSSKQSTSGTVESCEGVEDEITSCEIQIVRMTAHAYKALFQKQEKKVKLSGQFEELDGLDKSSIKDVNNSGDRTQKEGSAAGEICHITSDDSLPDQEEVEVICEEELTLMRQKFDHNFQFQSYPKPVDMDRSDDPRRIGGISLSCEKSAQPSVPSLDIQGNDSAAAAEQHSRCTAAGSKDNSSQFMEYWVPAQMSHVQLEQYCSILLKSPSLRSSSRTDPVGALRDILNATRKCCDHPYLVDSTLQKCLTKDVEPAYIMDIGIQASGKLELLVKFLVEMRTRGLRALILFQNIGSFGEKDSITVGDILDDAVRQRFGEKSYERIDGGLSRPKIQTALNNFNNKELERFVFLMEARACRPFIKLSSVDVVVIFGSDWQPANDIRNLQKMTLGSESENIKVFRLYSCFTVEEKVLISSKKGFNMDGRVQDRTPSICHMLLMWEAKYLFNKLNEFHCSYSESSRMILSDPESTEDVVTELLSFLPVEKNNLRSSSMVVRVENDGIFYKMDFPLYGESKSQLPDGESVSPPTFWTKLLEGKHPRWKYLSGSSQRNRNRNIRLYESDADEVGKKRKKLANNDGVQSPKKRGKGPFGCPPTLEEDIDNCTDGRNEARKLCDPQRSLHQSLQHEISKICEVLNLGDKVNNMTRTFLDYVINNHHVTQEPASILQAFQLALCWTAASILKVKVDHKESLQLVQTHMSYGCKKEEVDFVYTMLCGLKKTFLERRSSDMRDVEDSVSSMEDVKEAISNAIKKIKREYGKQMEKLMQQQKKEIDDVQKAYEAEKAALENKRQIEVAIIRLQYRDGPTRTNKLNTLEGDMTGKIEECKNQMTAHLNQLDRTHHASRTKLHLKEFSRIISIKEWAQTKLVDENAQTSDEGPDDPTNVNVCNLSETGFGLSEGPCDAAVSSACESSSEGLVDHDQHNCISSDPCVRESIADGVNSPMADGEVSLDGPLYAASCANAQADRVTLLPNREGVCSHSETANAVSQKVQPLQSQIPDRTIADEATEMIVADETADAVSQNVQPLQSQIPDRTIADEATVADETADAVSQNVHPLQTQIPDRTIADEATEKIVADETADAVSQNVQPLQSQIPDRTIADEATKMIVADDFTSVVEQDISAIPHDQSPHPNEFGDSTPVQPLVTCASEPTVFPEEPHDQPNGSCTLRTAQGEIASLIEQLNSCALVSLNSEAADAELTPSAPDLSRVDTAAHLRLEGQNSTTFSATRPFEEVLEPLMNSASGHWTGPPGFENTHNFHNVMPSGTFDPLQTEIDKINKEEGIRMRDHKNQKMELELECQKEIEQSVSQIRLKYKSKKQEAEELYKNKKNELAVSRHQVYMSMILAASFRYKYMGFTTPEARSQPDLFSELQLPLSSAQTSTMLQSVTPVQALPEQKLLCHNTLSTLHTSPSLSGAQTSTMQLSVNPVLGLPVQQLLCYNTPSTLHTPALSSAQTSSMQQSVNPVQGLPAQQLLCHNTPSTLNTSPALSSAQTSTVQQSVNPVQGNSALQLLCQKTSTMQQSVNPVQGLPAQPLRQNTPSSLHTSPALFSTQTSTMRQSVNPGQGLSAQLLRHSTPINVHAFPALSSAQSSTMRQSVNPGQGLSTHQLFRHSAPSNLYASAPALSSAQTSTMRQSVNPVQQLQAQQLLRQNTPTNWHTSAALSSAQSSIMQRSVDLVQQLQIQQLLRQNTPSNLHTTPALSSAPTSTMQQSVNPVQGLSAQQQLRHNAPIRASTPRPPLVFQFTGPVNVQVRGNKRGPVTHLQPNRPRPSISPSPASVPPRGTYQPIHLPPSTSSHRNVSVAPGALELLRGQQNPTPQMNITGQPPEGSSSNTVEIRSRRENGAAGAQVDSSQIICTSDDE